MKNSALLTAFLFLTVLTNTQAQHFVEAQTTAGIDHVVDNFALMGGGAAFFDADNDGDDDLYLTGGLAVDHFYLNNGDGTYSYQTEEAGFAGTDFYYTTGVTAGDVDNDGDKDLFVYTWRNDDNDLGRNLFYRNNGDGTFTEDWPFVADAAFTMGATFLDYDLDGWLDLYVVNYVEIADFIYDGGTIIGFEHTCFGNRFYHNNGDGTFTERAADLGLEDTGCALATTATDFNNDGAMDLYIANDFGEWIEPNKLYRNNYPNDNFTEIGETTGSDLQMYGMGIAIGDIDQDLDFDYYITNFGRNELIRNDGDTFTNITEECGAADQWVVTDTSLAIGWGTAFLDIDNDTDLDLYVANGYVPGPDFIPSTFLMNDKLFLNEGELPFADVGEDYGITNPYVSRGMAFSDYDMDGDLDILSVVLNGPANVEGWATLLYRNEMGNQNNWLEVDLEGVDANRDAYGSKVIVYADDKALLREVDGGSSHASHSSSRLHFGLGEATAVDSIEVIWTGGLRTQMVYENDINQILHIVEDTTIAPIVSTFEVPSQLSLNQLMMAPNPATDQVTFTWEGPASGGSIQLAFYNTAGQLVGTLQEKTSSSSFSLDLSQLAAGIYFVHLSNGSETTVRKLVVR
ncbi:MAG: FG-GAP-like repeat-containing protein [Bacteroidota bacterium]